LIAAEPASYGWLVDLLIAGSFSLALFNGFSRGAIVQAFSWGGFVVGMMVGGLIGPPIVDIINPGSPTARAIAGIAAFLGTAFAVEVALAYAGMRVQRKITHDRVKRVDAIAGSAIAGSLALLTAFFLSVPAKRSETFGASIKDSVILRSAYALLPAPPDLLSAIGAFLSHTGFPEVFTSLNPALAPGVEPAPKELAKDQEVLAAARLTYKIESEGCGGRVDGSGFPVGNDLVITAAHVLAGTKNTKIMEAEGRGGPWNATVVYMDAKRDIAVLRAPSLPNRALTVRRHEARRGTDGAAIGYPGGGPRKISVARVRGQTEALGRDIYSRGRVEREIYVLRAVVKQGNSGGPFVDTNGDVRGMIFAASSQEPEESYALTEVEVIRAMNAAASKTRGVDTGSCAL
jgi:S1-C subfamily serine protease